MPFPPATPIARPSPTPAKDPVAFTYCRPVRFQETDAAGVLYFANGLGLCHEAYEAALAAAGVDLAQFFSPTAPAYPVVHADIDFRHPLRCGEEVAVTLTATQLDESSFELRFALHGDNRLMATALTRHVAIDAHRRRCDLEPWLRTWVDSHS